ncbi:MAG: YgjV family protein [Proteobacteria bacterium]|nr:YgjV family protein [Pseudomonadota bacterium]
MLGMVTFSRKHDGHFKLWLTVQNLLYGVHFFLMGNPAAVVSMGLSVARNLLSLRTRALWVALLLLVANLLLGFFVVKSAWNVLPLLAVAIATLSMFRLDGLRLRYGMLLATLLWLANNILTGSIGGTVMECVVAIVSCVTIFRLRRDAHAVSL